MSSFCKCKSYSHFFSKNLVVYAIFNDQSFNDTLTHNIVSFEQLGPDWTACLHWLIWISIVCIMLQRFFFFFFFFLHCSVRKVVFGAFASIKNLGQSIYFLLVREGYLLFLSTFYSILGFCKQIVNVLIK